MVKKIVNC